MKNGLKILLYLTVLVSIALFASLGIIFYNTISSEKNIFNGVHVNNIDVGGMTKDNARKVLEEKFNKPITGKTINLNAGNINFKIEYSKLNAHYDIESAVNKAFEYGKNGNIIDKTRNRFELKNNPVNIDMEYVFDESTIDNYIKEINSKVNKNPKDAEISFDGRNFKVTPEVSGTKVNEEKLKQMISEAVKPESTVDNITVPTETIEARVKKDMLSKINTKISSFTTAFKPSDINRTENIKIAANQANGTLILPGEVFSMNRTLGPRVVDKGYKEAPVIINGTVVPGLAGGICQVTTTIYNAVLLSDLEIVERRQHGLTVSYVGAGRDATISGDVIDFKFKNTNRYPVYLHINMGKSTLTVSIYGANEHPGRHIEITSEIVERVKPDIEYIYDSSLENGKKITEVKPITGIKSKTYKKIYQNDKLVKTELVSSDYYKPVKGKIRIGTKPVSVVPTPDTPSTQEPALTEENNDVPVDNQTDN